MLPLFVAGAGLLTAGKIVSDMNEAEEIVKEAQIIADEGNSYLNEAKEKEKKVKDTVKKIKENQIKIQDILNKSSLELQEIKKKGLEILLNNYNYFKDLDLNLGKYEKYRKSIENEITKNNLSIELDDIISLSNLKIIIKELGIDIDETDISKINYNLDNEVIVENAGIETIAGIATHGIMAAGIGGTAALFGAELLTATGVGALIAAPFILSVSGDKVDEAKKEREKAKQFREKARQSLEKVEQLEGEIVSESFKWTLRSLDINSFYRSIIDTYIYFIEELIDISNYFISQYEKNKKDMVIIVKNLITLAYLNKFLNKYPSSQKEMGDIDKLMNWIEKNMEKEANIFKELENDILKIKEG